MTIELSKTAQSASRLWARLQRQHGWVV